MVLLSMYLTPVSEEQCYSISLSGDFVSDVRSDGSLAVPIQ